MTDTTAAPAPHTPATALLLGATGLVGGHVLDLLLADPAYTRVTVLGRRPVARMHPKLDQRTADFERLREDHAISFAVDDVFCCLGTTIKAAGSQEAFRRVDHDYVVSAARAAAEHGARRYLLVSAAGASARSRIFYNRVKGEAEDAVRAQPLDGVVILRPSLLMGERAETRTGEQIAQRIMPALDWMMVGPLRRYRPIEAATVARAMVRLAKEKTRGVRVLESDEIQQTGGA
ncbi:oxidoreductase [Longimicrobium sp.]|uniref:oxidoreductase n=1 Tax=Longimicrobium sp. TaxID=2029185 RepID=UPI002E37A85E|nr:oxidoreductase [Longimicrobium sp.]HEX6042176.1 oxidoreductase [Longimicrobium sp.]